jgi:hypothetical protein
MNQRCPSGTIPLNNGAVVASAFGAEVVRPVGEGRRGRGIAGQAGRRAFRSPRRPVKAGHRNADSSVMLVVAADHDKGNCNRRANDW